jgi:signal transduction histidine kinase
MKEDLQPLKEFHWIMDMVSTIDVGLVVIDRQFTIQLWNGFMENHSGLPGLSVLGHSLFKSFPEIPENWLRHKTESVFLLKDRVFTTWDQRPYLFKFKNLLPITGSADYMYQDITIIPLLSTNGDVKNICLILYDVTDVAVNTKQLEQSNQEIVKTLEKLKDTQKQLVESEKMSSLGGLVAGVAHEINTPIGIGVTAASNLQDKTYNLAELYKTGKMSRKAFERFSENVKASSDLILSNLKRVANLIQIFKQVTADQSSEQCKLIEIKSHIAKIVNSMIPKFDVDEHRIVLNCPQEISLNSYPGSFSKVITSLLSNSLQHGFENKKKGTVTINIEKIESVVVINYNDDGLGIPPKDVEKIFDPFFTTKRGAGCSGLGLHIVYNQIKQNLGGSINCSSVLKKGTTFIIKIPL